MVDQEEDIQQELAKIEDWFRTVQAPFMSYELAVCFVCDRIRLESQYASKLIQEVEAVAGYRLSDTILYKALSFLRRSHFVREYSQSIEESGSGGRGRPRQMFAIGEGMQEQVIRLSILYQQYVEGN